MKIILAALLLALSTSWFTTPSYAEVRTLRNNNSLPREALRRMFSSKIYNDLADQPIQAWIIVRGRVRDNLISDAKVVKSERNGIYDKAAVQLANGMKLYSFTTGTNLGGGRVLVNILIYQTREGEMALCLAQDDGAGAGGKNLVYSDSIRIDFLGIKK